MRRKSLRHADIGSRRPRTGARRLGQRFAGEPLRVCANADLVGAELAGALKNVIGSRPVFATGLVLATMPRRRSLHAGLLR